MKKNAGVLLLATLATAFSACVGFAAVKTINDHEPEVVKASEGTYWSGLDLSGATYGTSFRKALYDIMVTKGTATGSNSYKGLNSILAKSDAMPDGSGTCAFYRQDTVASSWNKEHVWPNSRGAGENAGYAGTDPQVIRPTNTSDNSSRSNYMYGETTSPSQSNGWDPNSFGYDAARGEAARIILYAAVRYWNKASGAGGSYKGSASGLSLTNNLDDATTNATMGKLSTLLAWNAKYPVTRAEIYRNDYLSGINYARNPFIDHPTWANYIWNSTGLVTSNPGNQDSGSTSTTPSLYLSPSALTFTVGDSSSNVTATASNFSGTVTYTMTSSPSSSIATASLSGSTITVTPVAVGTTSFTVKATDGTTSKTATCQIAVNAAASVGSSATILPTTTNMPTSYPSSATVYSLSGLNLTLLKVANYGSIQFKAPSPNSYILNASPLAAAISSIVITYSSTKYLTVTCGSTSSLGTTVTPTTSGKVYTYDLNGATYFKLANMNSSGAVQVASIQINFASTSGPTLSLSPTTLSLTAGGSTATSTVTTNGTSYTVTGGDSTVATASKSSNTITVSPVGAGSCSFTVIATDGTNTKTVYLTVTVVAPTVSVSVSPTPASVNYNASTTATATASGFPDGTSVTYTISGADAAIATTSINSSSGLISITGVKGGTTTASVTATGGSYSASVSLDINVVKTLSSLSSSGTPSTTSYSAGSAFQSSGLTITATFNDGSTDDVTDSVTWSALTEGSTSVTGTYTYGSSSKTVAIGGLTVSAAAAAGTYTLLTSLDQLSAGKHVAISNTNAVGDGAYFASTSTTDYGFDRTTNTINSDSTVTPSSTTEEFLLGGSTGAWTLATTKSSSGGTIYYSGSSYYLKASSSPTSGYQWSISINSGYTDAKCNDYTDYYLGYYNGSTYYFDVEGSGSSIYFFVENSTTPSKTVTDLVASGTPSTTSYTAGQSFNSSGLTVTATYDDGTTANVVSSVTWTPSPLTQGTTSVTGTYGGKTVVVSGITVSAAAAQGTYQLVTSADQLTAGSKYLIGSTATAGTGYFLANSAKNTYYMAKADVTVNSDITVTPTSTTEELTLGGSTGAWTFQTTKNSTAGTLCNTVSGSYYDLMVKASPTSGTDYTGWAITVASSGAAKISSTVSSKTNYIYYASTYTSYELTTTSSTVYLYKEIATGSSDLTLAKQWAVAFNTAFSNICNAQGNTAIATIQSTWSTQYSNFGNLASSVQAYLTASTSTDSDITAMWAKYTYIYNKYSTNLTTSGGDFLSKGSSAYKGEGLKTSSESTAILVVASMMAAGLLGFYLLKKKKAI